MLLPSNTNNFSKYPNPGIQFQDKKNPQWLKNFYLKKMLIFQYHIISLHFPEAIKE